MPDLHFELGFDRAVNSLPNVLVLEKYITLFGCFGDWPFALEFVIQPQFVLLLPFLFSKCENYDFDFERAP